MRTVVFGRPTELLALRRLGSRGRVSVVLCEDRRTRRQVVAKQTRLKTCESSGNDALQELRVARLLHRVGGHPHIVSFYSGVVLDDWLCLTMEHCAGGDLYSFLEAQPEQRLRNERHALMLWRQVVSAVAFLHSVGIAHRDLSLENVLLDERHQHAKLCDFGLSVSVGKRDTRDGGTVGRVGKPYYMAPEVVQCTAYDACRADVWSLGVMLFIMVSGSPLVELAAPSDRVFQVLQRGVQPSAVLQHWGLHGSLSTETLELLDTLLQCDPDQRPSSAAHVLARMS
ncbi:hypothetical protein PINS_up022236 [Pythium insidiosum]|nr:hypothetical protein PINS_up022236 [Pythium insidiosum]